MNVADPAFLAVSIAAVAGVRLFPSIRRPLLLLVLSAAFAALALDPRSLALLGGFILLGHVCIRFGSRIPGRPVMAIIVTMIIGSFWMLKAGGELRPVSGTLPVVLGLSYVMFRILHLLIDVREGALPEPPGFVLYVGYLLFFPNFLAGPIQRYEHYTREISGPVQVLDRGSAWSSGARIATGFFKLIVLAGLAERGFAACSGETGAPALAAAMLAFAVQLYFSFSGYMDVVIGLGRFLGMSIPENFNRPFQAPNFLEFWSRWHITLSEWFKFYVFNPTLKALLAADSRPDKAPYYAVLCFFLTFFLMGLWHGTTLPFVAYGAVLGFGVSVNKLWQTRVTRRLGRTSYTALTKHAWYATAARSLAVGYFTLALTLIWMTPDLASRRGLLEYPIAGLIVLAAVALPIALETTFYQKNTTLITSTYQTQAVGSRWAALAMAGGTIAWLGFSGSPVPILIYLNF